MLNVPQRFACQRLVPGWCYWELLGTLGGEAEWEVLRLFVDVPSEGSSHERVAIKALILTQSLSLLSGIPFDPSSTHTSLATRDLCHSRHHAIWTFRIQNCELKKFLSLLYK